MHQALHKLRSARFAAPAQCAAAVASVQAQHGLDFGKARVRAGFGRGHLLDVVVYLPGGSGGVHESEAAEELVRLLVGEELFERWVGSVSATPAMRGGPLTVLNTSSEQHSALPLETLAETARAAVAGLKLGLPALPSASNVDADDWFAFELAPEPASDYAAQDDLIFCSTRVPELKKSFLRAEPFFSGRFTNSGALFVYLKFETQAVGPEARLAERALFEDALRRALTAEQGLIVGLGLGVRHSYIDLALLDPSCVAERVLPALRAAHVSKRSWLLFCDSELEREHVSIYSDSPDPYCG